MFEKFRKKMTEQGRTLTWFHWTYLRESRTTYTYFIQQINGHVVAQDVVILAIDKFLIEA